MGLQEDGGRLQQVELQLVTIIKCGISADVLMNVLDCLDHCNVHTASFPGSGVWTVDWWTENNASSCELEINYHT